MSGTPILLLIAGLAGVLIGAELVVRSASALARAVGLSPLAIGLTVVAIGTSAPEIAVSAGAAAAGELGSGLALGNVVGSNLFNILVVLGLTTIVAPVAVSHPLLRFDVPVLVGVSVGVWLLALDGALGRGDGAVLGLGLIGYIGLAFRRGRSRSDEGDASVLRVGAAILPRVEDRRVRPRHLGGVVGGLALLVVGADGLVEGAIAIARTLGVSELVIGLTIVAVGTSLPEAATSIVAGIRGERTLAVGNVIGSSLVNLLGVLGLAAVVAPEGLGVARGALTFDLPIMIAVAIACLPVMFTGYRISRWEGWVFLGYYLAYVVYLGLDAAKHHLLDAYGLALGGFVLPLTVLTLGVIVARQLGRGSASR